MSQLDLRINQTGDGFVCIEASPYYFDKKLKTLLVNIYLSIV